MKVGVFLDSANHERFRDVLKSFAKGVEKSGDTPFISTGMYEECDVAVIFGSWKDRKDRHHVVKNDIIKKAKKFIVLETPIIGRGPVTDIMQDDWYRIGINGFLADTGNFNNKNCDDKRWQKIKKELDVNFLPWRGTSSHITSKCIQIILQLPGDASLNGIDISDWALNCVKEIRKIETNRHIKIRKSQIPREYSEELINIKEKYGNLEIYDGTKDNIINELSDTWASVTYSSGFAVDSILYGVPSITMSPSSFGYSISSNSINDLSNLKMQNRNQWINNLSYCQWSHEEIEDGLPWNHLKEVL